MIRPSRAKPRETAQRQPQMQHKTFPAPVRGLILDENLAAQGGACALVLDNFFPTRSDIELMGGSKRYATISTGAVVSMWTYSNGGTRKLFAADEENIFDISTIADADTIPTAAVTGQTGGYYSAQQISTGGGNYQVIVNGRDDAQLYDGSSFQVLNGVSSPAITGIDTADLSFVWKFANRLWFIERSTMRAWYLPVNSIGGTATEFNLSAVFQKGGSLLFGGSWSLDSGDGLDDKCIFVSDLGEVAVYQGSDPSSLSTWGKVGVYDVTPPLGQDATMRSGGDFLIATQAGIVPLSQAVQKTPEQLNLASITRAIQPLWIEEVNSRQGLPWQILEWPSASRSIVSLPVVDEGDEAVCLVVNTETGAWCRRTGWDTRCMALYRDTGFFGTNSGTIEQMEIGGSDNGAPYTGLYVGAFDHLGSPANYKTVHSARVIYRSSVEMLPKVTVGKDYAIPAPTPPNSRADYPSSEWDVGLWDVAVWDAGTDRATYTQWSSIGDSGFVIAPVLQFTSGITPKPRCKVVAIDLTYETGGVQV